ncbi:MAG: rod-binding protein [Carboxydocellales bacterium]|jgi:flagellar protein FlgJ
MEIAKIAALAPIKIEDTIKAKQGDGQAEGQSFQQALEKAASSGEDQKLREACQQMESLFIYQLMERMRAAVPRNDLWGDSAGVQIFQGMLDEEYAKNMSKAGGIGLGQMLYDQLKRS